MTYYAQVEEAVEFVRARAAQPDVAVVLGSGLGEFASRLQDATVLPYGDLPHWPASKVVGHDGRLVVGTLAGKRVAALSGRVHFYEGHDLRTVTFATRVMASLGVRALILTNAAGGINTALKPGTLMVIDDHINLLGSNPLTGPNEDRWGARFPDMSEVYSRRLRGIADEVARAQDLPLGHGVYIAVLGPSYETPAEIRAFRALGADAVGMSTVPEVIAARAIGMRVLGISCITNLACGLSLAPITHAEVLETTARAATRFSALVRGVAAHLQTLNRV